MEPRTDQGVLIEGNLRLPSGQTAILDFECTGDLVIEKDARIEGTGHVQGNARLACGASLGGTLHVKGSLDADAGVLVDCLRVDGVLTVRGRRVGQHVNARDGFEVGDGGKAS